MFDKQVNMVICSLTHYQKNEKNAVWIWKWSTSSKCAWICPFTEKFWTSNSSNWSNASSWLTGQLKMDWELQSIWNVSYILSRLDNAMEIQTEYKRSILIASHSFQNLVFVNTIYLMKIRVLHPVKVSNNYLERKSMVQPSIWGKDFLVQDTLLQTFHFEKWMLMNAQNLCIDCNGVIFSNEMWVI